MVYKSVHGEEILNSRQLFNLVEKGIQWLKAGVREIQTRNKTHRCH